MPLNQTQLAALSAACEAALPSDQVSDVPAELTVCQWAIESAWGKDQPGNNPFGLKARHGDTMAQLLPTKEYFTPAQAASFVGLGKGRTASLVPGHTTNGRDLYDCQDLFAAFPNLEAAFSRHADLITGGTYFKAAFTQYQSDRDIPALVRNVAVHYSTAPNYADQILEIGRMPQVVAAIQSARGNS